MYHGYEYLRSPEGTPAPDGGAGGSPPPAPSSGTAPPQGGTPPSAGGNGSWLESLPAEDRAWAETKGLKDPASVVGSYRNLEQLFGADKAGLTVRLPKDATDTAATEAVFAKLGKPDAPDKYEIALPEGADPAFANTMKGVFHKANLTLDQSKVVTQAYQAAELDFAQKEAARIAEGETNLKTEWGDKYDTHKETARAAFTAAGMDKELVERLTAIDPVGVAKAFEFFGRNYVEAGPPGQEGRSAPGFNNVTPAAAQQKVDALYADQNFQARYGNADPKIREAAIQEMSALMKVASNAKRV